MGNILGSALGIAGADFIWLLQQSTSSGSSAVIPTEGGPSGGTLRFLAQRGCQRTPNDSLLVSVDTPGNSH
jgi:hypothetical protein